MIFWAGLGPKATPAPIPALLRFFTWTRSFDLGLFHIYQNPLSPLTRFWFHLNFFHMLASLLPLLSLASLCCVSSHFILDELQRSGGGGLEDIQQDIRIPARFSAVKLQSLLASYCIACLAVCSNSQGYREPHRPSATCGTITTPHPFSLLTLSPRFSLFCRPASGPSRRILFFLLIIPSWILFEWLYFQLDVLLRSMLSS